MQKDICELMDVEMDEGKWNMFFSEVSYLLNNFFWYTP